MGRACTVGPGGTFALYLQNCLFTFVCSRRGSLIAIHIACLRYHTRVFGTEHIGECGVLISCMTFDICLVVRQIAM